MIWLVVWLVGFLIFGALFIAIDDGDPQMVGPEYAFWWPLLLPVFLVVVVLACVVKLWQCVLTREAR